MRSKSMDPVPYSKADVWAGNVDLTDRHVKYYNNVLAELRKENPQVGITLYCDRTRQGRFRLGRKTSRKKYAAMAF